MLCLSVPRAGPRGISYLTRGRRARTRTQVAGLSVLACGGSFRFRPFMVPPRAARSLLTAAYANPIVDGFARTSPRTRIIGTLTSIESMRRLRNTLWMIWKYSLESSSMRHLPKQRSF